MNSEVNASENLSRICFIGSVIYSNTNHFMNIVSTIIVSKRLINLVDKHLRITRKSWRNVSSLLTLLWTKSVIMAAIF